MRFQVRNWNKLITLPVLPGLDYYFVERRVVDHVAQFGRKVEEW